MLSYYTRPIWIECEPLFADMYILFVKIKLLRTVSHFDRCQLSNNSETAIFTRGTVIIGRRLNFNAENFKEVRSKIIKCIRGIMH